MFIPNILYLSLTLDFTRNTIKQKISQIHRIGIGIMYRKIQQLIGLRFIDIRTNINDNFLFINLGQYLSRKAFKFTKI